MTPSTPAEYQRFIDNLKAQAAEEAEYQPVIFTPGCLGEQRYFGTPALHVRMFGRPATIIRQPGGGSKAAARRLRQLARVNA